MSYDVAFSLSADSLVFIKNVSGIHKIIKKSNPTVHKLQFNIGVLIHWINLFLGRSQKNANQIDQALEIQDLFSSV